MKPQTIGWIIGFFVALFPIRMILPHDPIISLMTSIFGLTIAIVLEAWPR